MFGSASFGGAAFGGPALKSVGVSSAVRLSASATINARAGASARVLNHAKASAGLASSGAASARTLVHLSAGGIAKSSGAASARLLVHAGAALSGTVIASATPRALMHLGGALAGSTTAFAALSAVSALGTHLAATVAVNSNATVSARFLCHFAASVSSAVTIRAAARVPVHIAATGAVRSRATGSLRALTPGVPATVARSPLATELTAAYRRNLQEVGRTVQIYRVAGTKFDVLAHVYGLEVAESSGPTMQMKRTAIVLADDLLQAGFPLPFQMKTDRMLWNGRTLVITAADDRTRRVGGEIIAYELAVTGS